MPTVADVMKFVLENPFGSSLAVLLVTSLFTYIARYLRNRSHSERILSFLQLSAQTTQHTFRSTEAIAAATKLPESRVELLCSGHRKIKRNGAERQSWRLVS